MRRLTRTVTASRPAASGRHAGLAYSLWLPDREPRAGVVILHGAGSCKESHHDFARVLKAAGMAAITFDQRGHGDSDGPMDGRALEDVRAMAAVLRAGAESPDLPLVLRGSSMGGFLALAAAPDLDARVVVAICPASAEGLRRGLHAGTLRFDADVTALDELLASHSLHETVARLTIPVLLLHAAGDEQVPVEHSRELAKHLRAPGSRLIVVPGGHHRSIQHDDELQAVSVRFIEQKLANG